VDLESNILGLSDYAHKGLFYMRARDLLLTALI